MLKSEEYTGLHFERASGYRTVRGHQTLQVVVKPWFHVKIKLF